MAVGVRIKLVRGLLHFTGVLREAYLSCRALPLSEA